MSNENEAEIELTDELYDQVMSVSSQMDKQTLAMMSRWLDMPLDDIEQAIANWRAARS